MPRLVSQENDGYAFPLGIVYVSSALKRAGFNIHTINLNHRSGNIYTILKNKLEKYSIDVVCTGGLSFQYNTIKDVIDVTKKINPKIITIVGGGIITSDPEIAMCALETADYGVIGEGEITCCELCKSLENNESCNLVDGIIYKQKNKYRITNRRKEINNIDDIRWPDYDGFDFDQFLLTSPSMSGINKKKTAFMISSRSCPYNCTFCFHTIGRRYRQRSIDDFFKELDYLIIKYNIEYICVADELISLDFERMKLFCSRMKEYGIKWWSQFRVDTVTKEMIDILKEGGCDTMSFGLESADDRILKSMNKHTTVKQIENALNLAYEAGISVVGTFIFGDIAETEETATNTLNWWKQNIKYKLSLNLIIVYPGSYLYKYACDKKIITDKVKFLKDGCPQINVSKLTDTEFSELVYKIISYPMELSRVIYQQTLEDIDYKNARIDVSGFCISCGHKNLWKNIKIFTVTSMKCEKCAQSYNVVLPAEIRDVLEINFTKLIDKVGNIAIEGINCHTMDLFKFSTILKSESVFPIDISSIKTKLNLYGKKITSPNIINDQNIETVVIAVPGYASQIAKRIQISHKHVKHIVDICDLINPNYKLDSDFTSKYTN